MVGGSGQGKTTVLLNVLNHQSDIDEIFLRVKDSYKKNAYKMIIT